MTVTSDGPELLELILEPFGQDYWLQPGGTMVVTSYGRWDDVPFEVIHEPDWITIWATSFFATVTSATVTRSPAQPHRPPVGGVENAFCSDGYRDHVADAVSGIANRLN